MLSIIFITLRSGHLADDTFKYKFVNENVLIVIQFSLKYAPKGSIYNNPALVSIMVGADKWPLLLTWFNFNPSMDM